jgi:hypothetical protein
VVAATASSLHRLDLGGVSCRGGGRQCRLRIPGRGGNPSQPKNSRKAHCISLPLSTCRHTRSREPGSQKDLTRHFLMCRLAGLFCACWARLYKACRSPNRPKCTARAWLEGEPGIRTRPLFCMTSLGSTTTSLRASTFFAMRVCGCLVSRRARPHTAGPTRHAG